MRKINLFLLVLLFMSSQILAACSKNSQETISPVTITFYKRGYTEGGTDTSSITVAKAAETFHQNHPSITVKVVGIPWGTDGTDQLEAAQKSGEGIDVYSVNTVDLARYARDGYLSDISPYLTAEDRQDFYASGLQAASVGNKIYAWPLWVTTVGIYANTELLKGRGVIPATIEDPWTWDEFVAAAQSLTFAKADGTQVYGFSSSSIPGVTVYYPLMYIDGGRTVSPDGKRFVQNSSEALSALQKIADLALKYKATAPDFGNIDQAGAQAQFKAGTLAMLMDTPAFTAELEKSSFPFIIMPPPTGAANQIITTGAFGLYGVYPSKDSNRLKAAHEFARYLTSSQIAIDIPGYQLAPSLRRSNTAYASTPNRAIIARLVSFGLYEAPTSIPNDLRLRWETELQSIILGIKTPQQAMNGIAPDYQQALDQP